MELPRPHTSPYCMRTLNLGVASPGVAMSLSTPHFVLGMVSVVHPQLLLPLLLSWQVGLGISTLLLYVPTPLAATHQSGSLALLSMALWLMSELRRVPK